MKTKLMIKHVRLVANGEFEQAWLVMQMLRSRMSVYRIAVALS